MENVDLGLVLEPLIQLVAAAALGGLLWVIKKGSTYLGLENDNLMRKSLYPVLERAVEFGVARATEKVGRVRAPAVKNEILNEALGYTLRSAPEAIQHFGLTAGRLREILEQRLDIKYPDTVADPDKPLDLPPADGVADVPPVAPNQ